jgi:hypothetical protein
MMRYLVRAVWIVLALVFLVEAWLWDHLEPIVARLVAWLPLRKLKMRVAAAVEHLPPAATLIVFAVPLVLLFPLKIVALWFVMRGDWVSATGILVIAKLAGVGITAFIFDVTRDKLLLMHWFRWSYDHVIAFRLWAHEMVAPIQRRIRRYVRLVAPRHASRAVRLMLRMRRRIHTIQTTA